MVFVRRLATRVSYSGCPKCSLSTVLTISCGLNSQRMWQRALPQSHILS